MGLLNIKPMARLEPEVLALGFGLHRGGARNGLSRLGNRLRKMASCAGAVSLLAFGGIAFACAMAPATAQTAAASDNDVELDVTNANILSVVDMLRKPDGAQFIVTGDPKHFSPVTVHVSGPLQMVLKYVAHSADASITKDQFGVYTICPESDVKQVPAPAPAALQTASVSSAPEVDETISLNYVDPMFILSVLNVPNRPIQSPYDSSEEIYGHGLFEGDNAMKGIPNVVNTSKTGETTTNFVSEGHPSEAVAGVPGLSGTSGAQAADRATSTVGLPAQQFGGGYGGGGDTGYGNQMGNTGGNMGGLGGANGQNERVSIRPDGISSIIGVPEQNILLVKGTAEAIGQLRAIIQKLDVPAKQVQVKVEMVTVSQDDVNQFGINYDLIPIPGLEASFQPETGSSTSTAGSTEVTYSYGNVAAKLYSLLQTENSRSETSLIITLTNNVPGEIGTVTEIPYTTSTTVTSNSSTNTSSSTNYVQVPTEVGILAKVNGDNSVTIHITPQVANVSSYLSNGAPTVTTQLVNTIQTVGNGETFVMGGLTSKDDGNSRYAIPILQDIPIIGSIFRTRSQSNVDSEMLWFVTPTVLPAPGMTTTGEEVLPQVNGQATTTSGGMVTP